MDQLQEDLYGKVWRAAEVHRQVRSYAQSFIKPGIKLVDMCERLENKNRELVVEHRLEWGTSIGFPTGCSLNHVAAHYTPNPGDNTVLSYDDVMKVSGSSDDEMGPSIFINGSTGRVVVVEDLECSHYMKNFEVPHVPLRMQSLKKC